MLSLETPGRSTPIVWENLVQSATASWYPDLFSIDQFRVPMLLCSAVTESIAVDNPKQHLFTSPLVVEFTQAAEYFPETALDRFLHGPHRSWRDVIGIAAAISSRGDPQKNETILQAIDYLDEPEILVPLLLVLRPLDPAWDICRQRLRELAEAESFSVVTGGKEPDIEERRCSIREAIKILDKFFSDIHPQAIASLELGRRRNLSLA
ncbi:hypothetical protein IW261DRAFT_1606384 [Armillaria novae-zelandiae]|uniref:Uncharacterized protein n=1 Tax=Armillaria novae-zelandiae TaxID=153914 RepID=A0AA39PES5_9AGAR|nr:hypothetical protein IW261DRAFT_1606384 [Armillaria novae-zelandiae]